MFYIGEISYISPIFGNFLFILFSYYAVFHLITHTCARVFSVKAMTLVKKAYYVLALIFSLHLKFLEGFGSVMAFLFLTKNDP